MHKENSHTITRIEPDSVSRDLRVKEEESFFRNQLSSERHYEVLKNKIIENNLKIKRLERKINQILSDDRNKENLLKQYQEKFNELAKRCQYAENQLIEAEHKLARSYQTMSYRLGYAIIFGFKSWSGFKDLIRTISALHREGKEKKKKKTLPIKIAVETPPVLEISKRQIYKNQLFWESFVDHNDNYDMISHKIMTDLSSLSELKLSKEPIGFSIKKENWDSFVFRANLYTKDGSNSEKQAIFTIGFFDENGSSLESITDLPYSKKLKKYYSYLNVDSSVNNNILVLPPHGTDRIEISVQLWDNETDIYIKNNISYAPFLDGVSVIIPAYKSEKTIERCLESLISQDLSYSKYEIVLVVNGERDLTTEIVNKIKERNPLINIIIYELEGKGAGLARNYGIKKSSYNHITFVDADDYVGPGFLSGLYNASLYNNVVLTGVFDVKEGQVLESTISHQLLRAKDKSEIGYSDVTSMLTMNACKLAPSYMVKSVEYDTTLKSGEDVVYWTELLGEFSPEISIVDDYMESSYFRVLTSNSVSRQTESYDFNVYQRIEVISKLLKINESLNQGFIEFIQSKINAQAGFISRFLKSNISFYEEFIKDINKFNIDNEFIERINSMFSKTLVISYCYVPYVDTSGIVMSKRINAMAKPVDIIYNNMDKVRSIDVSLGRIAQSYIGRNIALNAPQSFSNWKAIEKFSELSLIEFGKIVSKRKVYDVIYSRAMWPASHFAAALIKIKYPHVKWIAEFSDPILMDVLGKPRFEVMDGDWLNKHGFSTESENNNLFYWCERLVYEFSDEIVFTNCNQKDYMISYADEDIKEAVREKLKIVHQPTLPEQYYDLSHASLEKEKECIYIGYFGSFYANRGFDTFLNAWMELDIDVRKKIRFCIYTQQNKEEIISSIPEDIRGFVLVNNYVGYFDFLKLTNQFDCLILMDCNTEGLKINNPYLPSKLSDYLGSKTRIFALVETGSPMDMIDSYNLIKSELKSINSIKENLIKIIS